MKPRTHPLGIELKEQRERQGLSLRQLADMINRNRGYLSQIELGKKVPGPRILEEIAGALDINRNVLLRHINLLKMEFTRPAVYKERRDPLAGLTSGELEEVLDYIDYLKYKRETEALRKFSQTSGRA
jgi:transcriptional regulator with XRE-family HTH domain